MLRFENQFNRQPLQLKSELKKVNENQEEVKPEKSDNKETTTNSSQTSTTTGNNDALPIGYKNLKGFLDANTNNIKFTFVKKTDVLIETLNTKETPVNNEPEKTKPTVQNLQDLYDTFRTEMTKLKSTFHGYAQIIEKMNESLQKYIDDNNLDISLDNLKWFFSDVMDKQPSGGAMASAEYLVIRFNDYIENGYTPLLDKGKLNHQQDELYKDFQDALDNKAPDTPEGTDGVQAPETRADEEPEKTKPTVQNLQDLYGIYRTEMTKLKSTFHGDAQIIEKMNESLQKYIDNNNLDISLGNLKWFFSDVMDKQPSGGAMASAEYLIIRFNDYIENGYTPLLDKGKLNYQQDELYKDFQDIFGNSNSGTPETKTTTELFDEITPSKPELREYVSNIMANDNDVDPSGINQYGYFTERELDTFVDSIISQVVKNSDSQDVETLLSEIKDTISRTLKSDPYAPMNINKSLMATDDYLLSDEEKKLKADLVDVEFDSDPTDIDGSGFDYSVMSNAEDKVADLTADWDISDIDSALNCKSPYTGAYSKNSSTITLYKNLEQLKPQLKAYIKEQLSAQGREYDEQAVEKYLNYYITETVREAIQAKYHDKLPELYPDTVLSADATLQDLGEYLVTKVKDEIAEGSTSFGSTWSTSGFDPLLNSTSDYFLTPEEIAQKKQMNNKKSDL